MKNILLGMATVLALCSGGCGQAETKNNEENRVERILREMHDPTSKQVLVISHRGDWRNWPENSIDAIESVIAMGVDIMELDLKLTKDSVLVLCHDKTIDRTTSGKGKVCDITYDSICRCTLKRSHGVKYDGQKMPTLREALEVCKDRIVVNIDQGYEYYDLALAITEELGMTNQVLIKGKMLPEVVEAKMAEHEHNMLYMPIIDINKKSGRKLFEAYEESGKPAMAYEVCFDKLNHEAEACMARVVESGAKLWVNTLWASLCGGYDDDLAWRTQNCDEVYGRFVDMGVTMIQTDRPDFLIDYLRSRGLHD